MSFQQKSTSLMLVILLAVYGWYFTVIATWVVDSPVEEVAYQPVMFVTVIALVVLAVIGHTLIAIVPPYEGDRTDERDRIIDLKGEWLGGFILGTGTVVALFLAMAEIHWFWIANTLLAGLVLSEVVTSITKLVYYRRMA